MLYWCAETLLERATVTNMNLRHIAKATLPLETRIFLRNIHRLVVFRRAIKKFSAAPGSYPDPTPPIFGELIYGWGNDGYSGLAEYLAACVDRSLVAHGPTLECGSGLSWSCWGLSRKKNRPCPLCLEHLPDWASKVQKCLDRYQLNSVILMQNALKDYGDYSWYDAPLERMPENFTLVVCDGPQEILKEVATG